MPQSARSHRASIFAAPEYLVPAHVGGGARCASAHERAKEEQMQRIQRDARENASKHVDDAARTQREAAPARLPFRPKVLPLALAALVGFGSAAMLATRDVARAQSPTVSTGGRSSQAGDSPARGDLSGARFEVEVARNTRRLLQDGRDAFRFDTFGDEDFWGGALQLHQAIEGSAFGGTGPGITPRSAIALGLKVDADAFQAAKRALKGAPLDLDSAAGTLALL
jgi:hypothetical protein